MLQHSVIHERQAEHPCASIQFDLVQHGFWIEALHHDHGGAEVHCGQKSKETRAMHHRARVEHGLPNVEVNMLECVHRRRQRRWRMGDELGRAVVPDVVSRTAGASLWGSVGRSPALTLSVSADQGFARL
jgi:hypothetical protein